MRGVSLRSFRIVVVARMGATINLRRINDDDAQSCRLEGAQLLRQRAG